MDNLQIVSSETRIRKRPRVSSAEEQLPKRCKAFPVPVAAAEAESDSGESEICSPRSSRNGSGSFFYFEQGNWNRFSEAASESLFKSLGQGKSVAEVSVWGSLYLINFALMLQINARTGYRRSVAWIDEQGRFLSPRFPFESFCHSLTSTTSGISLAPKLPLTASAISKGLQTPGGEPHSNPPSLKLLPLGDKVLKLEELSQEHQFVKKKFLDGLGCFAQDAIVTAIYQDLHLTTSGKARKADFQSRTKLMEEINGDSNVKLGWHGSSKQGICGIITHGFGQPTVSINGLSFGTGIYLAPEDCAYISAVYSDIDEIGEQHVVLCRVILGRTELVPPGSTQFHPSSDSFDTGVDNASHPTRYIVWSTHMNTHILPLYVVSFKLAPQSHEILFAMQGKLGNPTQAAVMEQLSRHGKVPRSPWMTFSEMLSVLRKKTLLPSADLLLLEQEHESVKAGKMSREEFVKKLKQVAGEKMLRQAMNAMLSSESVGLKQQALVNGVPQAWK